MDTDQTHDEDRVEATGSPKTRNSRRLLLGAAIAAGVAGGSLGASYAGLISPSLIFAGAAQVEAPAPVLDVAAVQRSMERTERLELRLTSLTSEISALRSSLDQAMSEGALLRSQVAEIQSVNADLRNRLDRTEGAVARVIADADTRAAEAEKARLAAMEDSKREAARKVAAAKAARDEKESEAKPVPDPAYSLRVAADGVAKIARGGDVRTVRVNDFVPGIGTIKKITAAGVVGTTGSIPSSLR